MLLTERYIDQIKGLYSCYANGMTSYLYFKKIRIPNYSRFAEPLRDKLRSNAEQLAKDNNLKIDFIRKKKKVFLQGVKIVKKLFPASLIS